jgi:uncharacterized protein with von Willebrand factor type A (vWA) domain
VDAQVIQFARVLRGRGLRVTQADVHDGLAALLAVDVGERREVRQALRTTLVHRHDDLDAFDSVFDAFWQVPDAAEVEGPPDDDEGEAQGQDASQSPGDKTPEPGPAEGEPGKDNQDMKMAAYSPAAALVRRDFGSLRREEEDRLAELCALLARRLAMRLGRRLQFARKGRRIDLRRSVRRSLRTGGDLLHFHYRKRRPRRTRVIVICDVSGSMEPYSRFLLTFVRALERALPRVEAFTFSTSLQKVTGMLRRPDADVALRAFFAANGDWAGGTRIGACLREFRHSNSQLLDRHTLLIICSDGLDTGDTSLLRAEMTALKRACEGVLWLNPLAADPAYKPLSLGMQAAMPSVDVLAPAGNLANLLELEHHVTAIVDRARR